MGSRRKAPGDPAREILSRSVRTLYRATGCMLALVLAGLFVVSGAVFVLARRDASPAADGAPIDLASRPEAPPGTPAVVLGTADLTRRRFYYRVEVDAFGRRRSALLIEYFPVRLADGSSLPVGRILAEVEDPDDRTVHADPRFERTPDLLPDQAFEGVVETAPEPIREDFRRGQDRPVRERGLLVDGGRTEAEALSARRNSILALAGLAVAVVLALLLARPIRAAFRAP